MADLPIAGRDKGTWATKLLLWLLGEHNIDGTHAIKQSVDGINTRVYTKYLTGALDNDAETSVVHGIIDANKILHVSVLCWDDTATVFRSYDNLCSANADQSFKVAIDGANVVISTVGAHIQGNDYRLKIDYVI